MNWSKVELQSDDPILLVGLRGDGSGFTPYRINVDKDVHPSLVEVGTHTLAWLGKQSAVPYTPYVAQEAGEYLTIDPTSLRAHPEPSKGDAPTEKEQAAAIVGMIDRCEEVEEMGAGQLSERLGDDFYLQAICLKSGDGKRVGFVTKSKPVQVMRRSLIPLGRDDATDRLKKISFPELVLESDVHVVIGAKDLAIINRTQFQFLVSDTSLIASYVPTQIERIADEFGGRGVALALATRDALLARAANSVQLAKRLDAFAERIKSIDVGRLSDGSGFTGQNLDPKDFVNGKGEIECEADRLPELIDALEGRYFDDPLSDEHRRADRFRKR